MTQQFPVVQGDYRLTEDWKLNLPAQFYRRIESGNMVLWRPGLTFWIAPWGNDNSETVEERLKWIVEEADSGRQNESIERHGEVAYLTYELTEEDFRRNPPQYISICGYVVGTEGHLQITAYFDDAPSREIARHVIRSACSAR